MITLCHVAEEFTEGGMKKAGIGAKEQIIKKGASEVLLEADLSKEKMNTDVCVDGSCGSRVGPRNREFQMFALKKLEKYQMLS